MFKSYIPGNNHYFTADIEPFRKISFFNMAARRHFEILMKNSTINKKKQHKKIIQQVISPSTHKFVAKIEQIRKLHFFNMAAVRHFESIFKNTGVPLKNN